MKTRKLSGIAFPLWALLLLLVPLGAVENNPQGVTDNPFFQEYKTPFDTPPFDRIKNEHFLPAMKEGIRLHELEIKAITDNPQAPTFANTLAALDGSGKFLERVSSVFGALQGANTSPELQRIAQESSPLLSAHYSNVQLDEKLFARIKSVYDKRRSLKLTPEELFLLENSYQGFVRNGALLDKEGKERIRRINGELSLLSLQFSNNLLAETNGFTLLVDNKESLAGLPENFLEQASYRAKGMGKENQWAFNVQIPTLIPFLTYAQNRELREKMHRAYFMRGDNGDSRDNKEIIKKIVVLRRERAKLLGKPTFADLVLETNMAKTPGNVESFLKRLWGYSIAQAKEEVKEMQAIVDREKGGFGIASWDWWYYAEKVRKEKYALEEEQLRPYFQLDNVKEGIFTLCDKLYGLKFKKVTGVQVYNPEVQVYEVTEGDGRHVGLLFMDFFPRASKRSGAWSGALRRQGYEKGVRVAPLATIVCNFTAPTSNSPALLTTDETETFFHEFGHALATLLSDGRYGSRSVPRDGVELPSQIMEHWAFRPELLKLYARHYKSGEVIPEELIQKIRKSSFFNQGFASTEYLAASILDMAWHTTELPESQIDVRGFEQETLSKYGLIPEILPRYRSTYFQHIFAGGYSAGYYVYIWAELLDSDAFEAFQEKGVFDKATATSFRKNILEKYGTADLLKQYVKFRGHEPGIEPLLKKRGFIREK